MAFSMKVTPEIEELTNICLDNSKMDVSLYGQYDVKRGLRDINGVGVLAGLTQISNVVSSDIIDGVKTPCDGRLYYRGINVEKLTQGFLSETVWDSKKLRICSYLEICRMKSSSIILRQS